MGMLMVLAPHDNSADKELTTKVASRHIEPLGIEQLVRAARSGSAAAFAELREIYAQRVYRKLLTITKNREDAEDALQDTFLRAYKALHTFEERSSFSTWVTRIGINSALMILRKRRIRSEVSFDRTRETEEDFLDFELKDTDPTPEHICVHRQRLSDGSKQMSVTGASCENAPVAHGVAGAPIRPKYRSIPSSNGCNSLPLA
jgi:RNA polymerase sigma-70 factor, ECF subfamily